MSASVAKFRPDSAGTTKKQCVVVQYFHDEAADPRALRPKSRMQVAHLYLKRSSFSRSESRLSNRDDRDEESEGDITATTNTLQSLQLGDKSSQRSKTEAGSALDKDNCNRPERENITSCSDAFLHTSSPATYVPPTERASGKFKSFSSLDFHFNGYLKEGSRLTRPYSSSIYSSKHRTTGDKNITSTPRRVIHTGKARTHATETEDPATALVTMGRTGYYRTKTSLG